MNMTMKITIKLPKNDKDKWIVSFGKGNRKRNNASTILNAIERYLLASRNDTKIAVKVLERVSGRWENINETIASENRSYLIWATSCFLEDFLSERTLNRIEKKYAHSHSL